MQALIDFLIRNLLRFWPLSRVYSWEQGVRVRCGRLGEELGPGLHWRWPFLDEVFRVTCAEQTLDLATGTVTTRDGRSVAVSAGLAYRVLSVRQMWGAVHAVDRSIANLALGFLAAECARRSWTELLTERDTTERELATYITNELASWGVQVTRVCVTDLVEARPWRVFGDVPSLR